MNKKEEANAIVKESITIALFQMMRTQRFEHITITELVKKAGVCRASFYRNYEDKEDIIYQYMKGLMKQWRTEFEKHPYESMIESLMRHYYENKDFYLMLYDSGMSNMILNHLMYECGPLPEQENETAYIHSWFACSIYGWVSEWLKRGVQESPETMAELYHQLTGNVMDKIR